MVGALRRPAQSLVGASKTTSTSEPSIASRSMSVAQRLVDLVDHAVDCAPPGRHAQRAPGAPGGQHGMPEGATIQRRA